MTINVSPGRGVSELGVDIGMSLDGYSRRYVVD